MSDSSGVLILGGEPCAFACALALTDQDIPVHHVIPGPFGLLGASREIGLTYPELGEPYERLEYALGSELARDFHGWSKKGIERISQMFRDSPELTRGTRLSITRRPEESNLVSRDALDRQKLGDEVRLMSGAAASNYAPLGSVDQASMETHCLRFTPIRILEALQSLLESRPSYRSIPISLDTLEKACTLTTCMEGVRWEWPHGGTQSSLKADLAVLGLGQPVVRLLHKFERALLPMLGQAFRTIPLREKTRASVVGVSAGWGTERYAFDAARRLIAFGRDPGSSLTSDGQAIVDDLAQTRLQARAQDLFSDFSPEHIEQRWGIIQTTTCDGLPLLGPLPGQPRIHLAEGFGDSAWSRGFEAGWKIAEALLGEVKPCSPLLVRCSPRRLL